MSSLKSNLVANDDDYVIFNGNVHKINNSFGNNSSEKHHWKKDVPLKMSSSKIIYNYSGMSKKRQSPLKNIVEQVAANSVLKLTGKCYHSNFDKEFPKSMLM